MSSAVGKPMKSQLLLSSILLGCCLSGSVLPAEAQGDASVIVSTAAEIYQEFKTAHPAVDSAQHIEAETVQRVSNRLIKAVTDYYTRKKAVKELASFQWEVQLFQLKKVDAWCLPGGKIAVYDALIRVTQSDGSLAAVLAHEIAHVLLKHGDERVKQILKELLGGKTLAAALSSKPAETKDFYRMAYGNGDYVGVIRGFSAADEREADRLGAIFCGLAGYKPEEALVFWERMLYLRGTGRQPELLSTHPVDDERLPYLRGIIEEITQKYYTPSNKK